MKVFTPRRRNWATVLLGAYLFIAPWIFGTSGRRADQGRAGGVASGITVRAGLRGVRRGVERVGRGCPDPYAGRLPESRLRLLELATCPEVVLPGAQDLPGEAPPVRVTGGTDEPRAALLAPRRVFARDPPDVARANIRGGGRNVRPGLPGLRELRYHAESPHRQRTA